MARFTEASVQAVFDKIDAVAVVEDYLRLEKKGGRYWGLCPFHHEKTPSFTVEPDRKFFYCFGCHRGGSIINFIMEMDKLSFAEAVETLAKRFGVTLAYENGAPQEASGGQAEALAELYRRVALSFHHLLLKNPGGEGAKQYILDRGIDIRTIEQFKLGYAPADRSWLYGFLSGKGGFSDSFLASSGLFSRKYPRTAFFSHRLMFPIRDRTGKTVAFGGRLLGDDGPKYINSPDSEIFKKGRTLFALDMALPEMRNTKAVYLAEGYMDVLALHQGGITNAVAPLGTAFTEDQAKLLSRWVQKVYLMLDSDEAGQNAAFKGILCCRKNGIDCEVVNFKDYFAEKEEIPKDPAEILQKFGPGELKKSVKCCILDLDFVISRSKALNKEKSRAVAFLFPYLDALDSEVNRDASIGVIADAFGVERRAVWDDYHIRGGQSGNSGPRKGVPPAENGEFRAGDELALLTAVFVNPGFFKTLRTGISLEDLEDKKARELFILLEEWYRRAGGELRDKVPPDTGGTSGPGVLGELLETVQDRDLRDYIIRQEASGAFSAIEKLLSDGITKIKSKVLERRRREIIRELRSPAQETVRQGDLLVEKIHIDTELTRLKERIHAPAPGAPAETTRNTGTGPLHGESKEGR
ncbi:MAG: DNA primase [Spirochaetaceae bacterium]|jgi:DNA primase|nr:DNA primase [Spirochaetaceae bacterium]